MSDASVFAKMQTSEPLAVYAKTIPARVLVRILNPFDDSPTDIHLQGRPQNPEDRDGFIELWTEKQLAYFKNSNKYHLDKGILVEYNKPLDKSIKKTMDNLSDEEIEKLLDAKFFTLKHAVEKMTSEAAVARVLRMAELMDKGEGTTNFLKEKLSKVQRGELEDEDLEEAEG
jgi:hypothetical protein